MPKRNIYIADDLYQQSFDTLAELGDGGSSYSNLISNGLGAIVQGLGPLSFRSVAVAGETQPAMLIQYKDLITIYARRVEGWIPIAHYDPATFRRAYGVQGGQIVPNTAEADQLPIGV
jgi:hypothetical protein